MIVLVYGATGFVAPHLAPRLARAGHRVYAAGHDPVRLQRLGSTHPEIVPLVLNLGTPPAVDAQKAPSVVVDAAPAALPNRVDAVVQLAQANAPFPARALELFEVNVGSTARLLDYARLAGAQHFVFASSGSVYGGGERPWREDDPTSGRDYYAATKIAGERLAGAYGAAGAFSTAILRIFAPYGPGQSGRLVPGLLNRVRDGQPVTLREGRGPRFNPLYIQHVCAVIGQALALDGNHVVNVGGEEALSIREMAETMGRALGRAPVFEEQPGAVGGDVVGDTTRMRAVFRLPEHLTSFEEGIRAMVAANPT